MITYSEHISSMLYNEMNRRRYMLDPASIVDIRRALKPEMQAQIERAAELKRQREIKRAERQKKFDELKQKVVTYIKKQAQFIKNMFRKNEDEKE